MGEKVISVTLVGPGDAQFLLDMLKSVDWCAWHYLVPWNISEQKVRETVSGDDFPDNIVLLDEIQASGFGEARTKAMAAAKVALFAQSVGSWFCRRDDLLHYRHLDVTTFGAFLMIDCDERWLGGPPIWPCGAHDVVSVICGDRTRLYARMPRLFGEGVTPSWEGETHEWYTGPRSEIGLSDRYEIVEIPKTPYRMARKLARDLPILQRMCAKDPLNVRHRFYVGETFRGLAALARSPEAALVLGEDAPDAKVLAEQAVMYYLSCARLVQTAKSVSDWDREQAGFACYHAAVTAEEAGFPTAAILAADAEGMLACPWMVELPWHAAWTSFQARDHRNAVIWARIAEAVSTLEDAPVRRGFVEEIAGGRGPREIEGFARLAMGDERGRDILSELGIVPIDTDGNSL